MIAPSWGTYYLYFGYDYDAQGGPSVPLLPNSKEMLEFYNKLYQEGLLLPNFLTIDTKDWQDVMVNSDSFITIDYLSRIDFFNKAMRESNPEFTMAHMVPARIQRGMSATSSRIPQRFCSALSFPARQNIWTKRLLH